MAFTNELSNKDIDKVISNFLSAIENLLCAFDEKNSEDLQDLVNYAGHHTNRIVEVSGTILDDVNTLIAQKEEGQF